MPLLEAAGYYCTHSGGSLGVFDVVGIGSTDVVLVQVKTRDWPGSVEMEQLKSLPCPPNCRRLIHRGRDPVQMPNVKEVSEKISYAGPILLMI
jgi:hypothetical protein